MINITSRSCRFTVIHNKRNLKILVFLDFTKPHIYRFMIGDRITQLICSGLIVDAIKTFDNLSELHCRHYACMRNFVMYMYILVGHIYHSKLDSRLCIFTFPQPANLQSMARKSFRMSHQRPVISPAVGGIWFLRCAWMKSKFPIMTRGDRPLKGFLLLY